MDLVKRFQLSQGAAEGEGDEDDEKAESKKED